MKITHKNNVMSTTATNSQNQQFGSGMSKVYILDKYFHELQKFWDTEKRLQGKFFFFIFFSSFSCVSKYVYVSIHLLVMGGRAEASGVFSTTLICVSQLCNFLRKSKASVTSKDVFFCNF